MLALRHRAEAEQLEVFVFGLFPGGQDVQPHESRSEERSCHLRDDVWGKLCELPSFDRKSESHRRVDVSIAAAAGNGREYACHNRECPPACNHHPASTFSLRAFEQDVCNNAVA